MSNLDTNLLAAITEGRTEEAKRIINSGDDVVNIRRISDGNTALILAATRGFTDIVFLLLQRGANVNDQCSRGFTALMCAVLNNRTDIIGLLLDKGADVNLVSKHEDTVLKLAVSRGFVEIVRLLLTHQNNEYLDAEEALKSVQRLVDPHLWEEEDPYGQIVELLSFYIEKKQRWEMRRSLLKVLIDQSKVRAATLVSSGPSTEKIVVEDLVSPDSESKTTDDPFAGATLLKELKDSRLARHVDARMTSRLSGMITLFLGKSPQQEGSGTALDF